MNFGQIGPDRYSTLLLEPKSVPSAPIIIVRADELRR